MAAMLGSFYECTRGDSDPLLQLYQSAREYLLELLSWIRNALNDLWDYLAQVNFQTPRSTTVYLRIYCR